jgi:hypothetical protein
LVIAFVFIGARILERYQNSSNLNVKKVSVDLEDPNDQENTEQAIYKHQPSTSAIT